jgi:hypothetical protein
MLGNASLMPNLHVEGVGDAKKDLALAIARTRFM